MNNDGLEKLLWLLSALGAGNPKAHALIRAFGSLGALHKASVKEMGQKQRLSEQEIIKLEQGRDLSGGKGVIEFCLRNNIRILTAFDKTYPKKLQNITPCPLALFYKGNLFDFDDELCITIVGTRDMTREGADAARELSRVLSGAGAVIVSGLARGIDTMAHMGALEARGKTAAVLGCGIDVVYPPENKRLYSDIAGRGLLMSEFLPGMPPYPHHFQVRNRLLSALSNGVLVAESGKRGGSLITVRWALEHGKDIFALPGDVNRPQSEGTNALIKQGAKLVTQPMDILEEYLYTHRHKIKPSGAQRPIPAKRGATVRRYDFAPEAASARSPYRTKAHAEKPAADCEIALEKDEQVILLSCGGTPLDCGTLSAQTGIPLAKTLLILTRLELAGLLRQLPGGGYIRAED